MPAVLWPIPVDMAVSGTSGAPQDRRHSFQTDSMIPVERTKLTARIELWNMRTMPLEPDQIEIFENWFDGDAGAGVIPFILPHPRTSTLWSWKFMPGDSPYSVVELGGRLACITLQARRLPAAIDQSAYGITADGYLRELP